ncbi:MAG: hypothetical protein HXY28_04080 [Hydrogenophilaceae bacterium]|jgi:hypothetical protein|nr:hypothetical protein [Hydrogenophilaceae bacterium]
MSEINEDRAREFALHVRRRTHPNGPATRFTGMDAVALYRILNMCWAHDADECNRLHRVFRVLFGRDARDCLHISFCLPCAWVIVRTEGDVPDVPPWGIPEHYVCAANRGAEPDAKPASLGASDEG